MIINVTYDSSVGSAPASFTSTVNAVVQYFETQFVNPITVNIDVGYGEIAGQSLGSGALGESMTYINSYSYSQIRSALAAGATSAADATAVASLPSSDPGAGGSYWVATAEAKAMGLAGASSSLDGYVGFSSAPNIFDYNNADGVTAGQYDFFGVVAHEISEVMGRFVMGGSSYTPLALFDYSAAGVRDMSGAQPGYFSINGGSTNLDSFNSNAGGDLADWASSAGNDAFLAFAKPGVVLPVTPTDLTELDVMGWKLASSSPPPPPPNPEANESPEAPALTIANHSVGVSKFGSTSLPITVAGVDSDDTLFVTIKGLTKYESITDALDHKIFTGSSITLTAAEVASGLTLKTFYTGRGAPTNALTVSASNTTAGEAASSASQTINVTVGSTTVAHAGAGTGSAHTTAQSLALLTQFLAGGFGQHTGAPMMTYQSSWGSQDNGTFLSTPHHPVT